MSLRNGDKSGFNLQRRQNIASRRRTHEVEVMEHAAKAPEPGEISSRVQARSVTA